MVEFFNKKQDVIDLQLTSYGKQLLTRGLFKPVYYAFSDDGVLYDNRWVSGTLGKEQQSAVEQRIQEETPRLKTQYTKVGADRGLFNLSYSAYKAALKNIFDLFEFTDMNDLINNITKIKGSPQFAASEKLLENILGTKEYFNQYNPAWNILLYNGKISSSTAYYKKNDITTLVPQLNCTLKDTIYKLKPDASPYEEIAEVTNILNSLENSAAPGEDFDEFEDDDPESWSAGEPADVIPFVENNFFEQLDVEDGSLFIIKDFLFVSVEELNSPYTNDNFSVEVFEVTTKTNADDGEEELQKMFFADYSNVVAGGLAHAYAVEPIFKIEVDSEINNQLACALIGRDKQIKNQSIYNTNIFNCVPPPDETQITTDPYTNLPPVEPEDVC